MLHVALIASALALLPNVNGHGYIINPEAQWKDGYPVNGYSSTINSTIFGVYDNSKYGYGPNATLSFFKDVFPTKYDSLGAFIMKNQELYSDRESPECGLTIYNDAARSELPPSHLTYSGFTHPGPCEVWCDDTKVLFEYNCQTAYSAIPATMPYDQAKCVDANRLTIFWIALHGDPWQVYANCVWLQGGSGSGGAPFEVGSSALVAGASDTSSNPTEATTSQTDASTAATTPSTVSTASEEVANEASVPTGDSYGSPTPESPPASEQLSVSSTKTSTKCTSRN